MPLFLPIVLAVLIPIIHLRGRHTYRLRNKHTSLEKYTSHILFERVVCERLVGDRTDCNILTPSSSGHSSTSSSFSWAAQPGS